MDKLFTQEEIHFFPVGGEFDVARVGEAVRAIGFTFQDEANPATFVVCPDEECRSVFSARRKQHPQLGFPYMLLVTVRRDRVKIDLGCGPEFTPLARELVEWLLAHYDCRVANECNLDLTSELPPKNTVSQ